jgi:hypothetical protein
VTDLTLGPDLNADLLPLVQQPEQWTEARRSCAMLRMFEQQIGVDDPANFDPMPDYVRAIGTNYYNRLRDAGFFSALTLPLEIETPGLKRWDTEDGVPTGKQAAFALTRAINRVLAAGGRLPVSYSMDDPFAESLNGFPSPVPIETVTQVLVRVAKAGSDMGVPGGITEAYPTCTVAQIIDMFGHVQQAGWSPRHLALDVDEQHARQIYSDDKISKDLKELQAACRSWTNGDAVCRFRIILNGQRGNTPATYRTGFWEWFAFAKQMLGGDPDGWILESWKASVPETRLPNGLPVNLPESSQFSHTGLLREVAALIPFPETHQ